MSKGLKISIHIELPGYWYPADDFWTSDEMPEQVTAESVVKRLQEDYDSPVQAAAELGLFIEGRL